MTPIRLLQGKVALVTGGSQGIGLAVATTLAAHGAHVVAVSRRTPAPGADGEIDWRVCDVSDEAAVEATVAEVIANHGRLDILVNNAGIADDAMIHRMTLESFRSVVDVNLQGTWLCTRSALRHMRAREGGGSIVNVASIAGKVGNLGQASYAASKEGVVALTKTTAREGARYGIRANAIRPGLIATPMTAGIPTHSWDDKLASIPLGRPGESGEVANAVLFLASDLASYITGAVLDVSGGRGM